VAAAGTGSRILRLHNDDDVIERTARVFEKMAEKAVAVSGGHQASSDLIRVIQGISRAPGRVSPRRNNRDTGGRKRHRDS